jgi:hypothetical protein
MSTINVAVDNMEWDSLSVHPERKDSPHKIRQGMAVEVQLLLWPDLILQQWNSKTPTKTLTFLGLDPLNPLPERKLTSLMANSNLCFFSGIARRIARHTSNVDDSKQTTITLLDCGLPVVVEEMAGRSGLFDKEGDYLMGVALMFGSIAFSRSPFRVPIVCKILKVNPLKVVPPATLLELEPLPPLVVPETQISYHAENVEDVELDSYVSNRVKLMRYK